MTSPMKGIKVGCGLSDPENWPCKFALPPDQNHTTHRCPRRCDHYIKKSEYKKKDQMAKDVMAAATGEELKKGGFENCFRYDTKCEHKKKKGKMLLCPSPCDNYESKDHKVVTMQGVSMVESEAEGDEHITAFGLDHNRIEQMLGLNQVKQGMTMDKLKEIRRECEKSILLTLKILEKLDVRVMGMLIVRPELPEGQKSRDGLMNIQDIKIQLALS